MNELGSLFLGLFRFFAGATCSSAAGTGAGASAGTASSAASATVLCIAVGTVAGIHTPVMMDVVASPADKASSATVGHVAVNNINLCDDQ